MTAISSATLPDILPTLISRGFFDHAAADLRRALAAGSRDAQAWRGLARLCRANGDLDGARQAIEMCRIQGPDDARIAYALAILAGEPLPVELAVDQRWMCPFVRIEEFLTEAEHATLIDVVSAQCASAVPSKVRDGEYQPEIRQSRLVPRAATLEVKRWFAPRLRRLLPEIVPRLSSDGMDAGRIEMQITVHTDGDFYLVHCDNHEEDDRSRRVSYVYYFHNRPKRFAGGDLLLYDSELVKHECHTSFTRVEPVDNSIVFFPSPYFHQVTPIRCETRDPMDGRFTVNGWIHAQETADAAPPA